MWNTMSSYRIPSIPISHKEIDMKKDYCCYDCKYLKRPFIVDETEMPMPTNPYCKLGEDKNFEKYQDKRLSWINHPKYEWERCKHFKLKWSIRLHIRKSYWKNYLERRRQEL